jgi:hypothetical protein
MRVLFKSNDVVHTQEHHSCRYCVFYGEHFSLCINMARCGSGVFIQSKRKTDVFNI